MRLRKTIAYEINLYKIKKLGTSKKIVSFEIELIEYIHGTQDFTKRFNTLKEFNKFFVSYFPYDVKPISPTDKVVQHTLNTGMYARIYNPEKKRLIGEYIPKASDNVKQLFLKEG